MTTAISVTGLVKTFGRTRALDGLDLTVAPARCTASWARTAPARPPRSGCCSACCAPTPARSSLLGGDPWRDAVALHRRLAYVPGDVNLWPNLSGGEAIDLFGDAARRAGQRRGERSCWSGSSWTRPRSAAHLLQGQPAEGRAGRRVRLRRRAVHPRRAHLRAGPADGGGVPGVRPRGRAARPRPCCCPATSSPRWRRCATGSASSATAVPSSPARWPSCAT